MSQTRELDEKKITSKLRLIQFFAAAQLIGVLVFASLISMIVNWEDLNEFMKLLNVMAGGTGIFLFMLSVFVPKMSSSRSTHPVPDKESIRDLATLNDNINGLITENILRLALISGGIFLNVVVFMIEPHLVSASIAGIGILLMFVLFPRRSAMAAAIDR